MLKIIFLLLAPMALANSNKALDQFIQQEFKKGKLVGAAVTVVDHGKVSFMKAYGVRKKGQKALVNLDTVFQLGSLSKPISASLVAVLQKKKLMSLDSPETRQALSHTTGYKRTGWNAKIESGWPRDRLLRELLETEHNAPGSVFDYNNLAFSQIEDLVSDSTKIPFKNSLQKYFFDPLKMTRTTVGFSEFSHQENRAWPHEAVKHGYRPKKNYSRNYHNTVMSAAGVNSSIKDMAKFLQFATNDKDLQPFLEPAIPARDAVHWFRKIPHRSLKSSYGYGWRIVDIDGERIIYHGGWVGGFINFLAFSPKRQVGIAVLCNAENSLGFKAAMRFLLDEA